MSWTNYHSHSHYCDGKMEPEAHIRAAVEKGFLAFGCSSHGPVPFKTKWSMKPEAVSAYVQEIRGLQQQFAGQIEVYLSMEVDFIPGKMGPSHEWIQAASLDYAIGSIHFVDQFEDGRHWEIDNTQKVFHEGLKAIFRGDAIAAVKRYYSLTRQMVALDCPEIVGHLDKIKMQNKNGKYFSEDDNWYRRAISETLETILESGVIVEVNTRGIYKKKVLDPYPSPWIIKQMYDMGIPVCLNSDSHHPDEIDGNFSQIAEMLNAIGYSHLHILLQNEWQPVPFDKEGIKIPHHG